MMGKGGGVELGRGGCGKVHLEGGKESGGKGGGGKSAAIRR